MAIQTVGAGRDALSSSSSPLTPLLCTKALQVVPTVENFSSPLCSPATRDVCSCRAVGGPAADVVFAVLPLYQVRECCVCGTAAVTGAGMRLTKAGKEGVVQAVVPYALPEDTHLL